MFQAQHFSLGLPPHFPSPLSSPSLQGQWSCWGCWAFDWSLWSCSPAEPRVLLSGRSHTHTPETDMQRSEIGSGRGDESDKQESFIWNLFLNPNPDLSVFGLWRHHQEENIFLGNEKKIRKNITVGIKEHVWDGRHLKKVLRELVARYRRKWGLW